MPRYIINKSSRYCSDPYSGWTCDEAGVEKGKIYDDHGEAIADANKLSQHNEVGFKVLDLQEVLDWEFRDRIAYPRIDKIKEAFDDLDPSYRFVCVVTLIGLLSEEEQIAIRQI